MLWIAILGGLLIMMGQHDRSEALFHYFRLEDQVPETHLLRLIEKHISFAFVRQKLKDRYSEMGRPSIDPELLFAHSLDRLPVRHHQRTQTGGGVAHAPGLALVHGAGFRSGDPASLNIFQEPSWAVSGVKVFEELFEQIVRQCVEVGSVEGKHLSVDGSFVEANAAKESRIPREQLAEAAQVNHIVRQYPRNWNSRTRWKNRYIHRIRCRPRILIPPTPPRVGHPPDWGTTTTI